MKKASEYRYLEAFDSQYGGLGSIERWLETRMDARFFFFKTYFVPPFVPPVCF